MDGVWRNTAGGGRGKLGFVVGQWHALWELGMG